MDEHGAMSGPQFRSSRPAEQAAVSTTIVGGRPPGCGQALGAIPRGMEVLLRKAAVDPEFKTLLLERRAAAAATIGLELEPAETMMLAAAARQQLEAIIARTDVPQEHRRAFLGQAAAAMLAAVTAMASPTAAAEDKTQRAQQGTRGIDLDRPNAFISKRVLDIVCKCLKIDRQKISRQTSLAKISDAERETLRTTLEKELCIKLPAADFNKLKNVGQVIDAVVEAKASTITRGHSIY